MSFWFDLTFCVSDWYINIIFGRIVLLAEYYYFYLRFNSILFFQASSCSQPLRPCAEELRADEVARIEKECRTWDPSARGVNAAQPVHDVQRFRQEWARDLRACGDAFAALTIYEEFRQILDAVFYDETQNGTHARFFLSTADLLLLFDRARVSVFPHVFS